MQIGSTKNLTDKLKWVIKNIWMEKTGKKKQNNKKLKTCNKRKAENT